MMNQKGHFYVCGNVKMAADVIDTLIRIIHSHGNVSIEEAKEIVNEMKVVRFSSRKYIFFKNYYLNLKETNRLHEDIFGLPLGHE